MKTIYQAAHCRHKPLCTSEGMVCRMMFPGFIGKEYKQLVIVGSHPSNNSAYQEYNESFIRHLEEFKKVEYSEAPNSACVEKFLDYLTALESYMNNWKDEHLVSRAARKYLSYDIEHIAFVNMVKCFRAKDASNDKKQLARIKYRCVTSCFLQQMEVLDPKYIVCINKATMENLKNLYSLHHNCEIGCANGIRTKIPFSDRVKDVIHIFNKVSITNEKANIIIRRAK